MRSLNLAAGVVLLVALSLTTSCNDPNLRDPGEQLIIDVEQIDNYIAASGLTAYKDVTGLRFSISTLGTGGFPPLYEQQVKVKYKGRLLDGTTFDEGTTTNYVYAYIVGWQRALPMLPKGTVATLYIPSGMAYGQEAVGPIPANSILIFDVEIQDVLLSAAEKLRAPSDLAAIDKHLKDHSITALSDTTGISYLITQEGSGENPGWHSKVKFNYTGRLLSTGETFATGTAEPQTGVDSWLVDYIHGVKFGLAKLKPGGKGTFYIPSGLAFGANTSNKAPVPAHTNVIYELELVEVQP